MPVAQPHSDFFTFDSSHSTFVPSSFAGVLDVQVTFAIEMILASASPLNPSEFMLKRSSPVSILLVACFEKASSISSGSIPQPLSETRLADGLQKLIEAVVSDYAYLL